MRMQTLGLSQFLSVRYVCRRAFMFWKMWTTWAKIMETRNSLAVIMAQGMKRAPFILKTCSMPFLFIQLLIIHKNASYIQTIYRRTHMLNRHTQSFLFSSFRIQIHCRNQSIWMNSKMFVCVVELSIWNVICWNRHFFFGTSWWAVYNNVYQCVRQPIER